MTCVTPSTWIPRAATSVATRICTFPLLNRLSDCCRCPCDLFPWIESALRPAVLSSLLSFSTLCFIEPKIRTRLNAGVLRSAVSVSNLLLCPNLTTSCAILSVTSFFFTEIVQQNAQTTFNQTWGGSISYTEPLGNRKYLEVNYNFRNNQNFWSPLIS